MRLLTNSGPVDLAFIWPPADLHLGRQAARRACERALHVSQMRNDPALAGGFDYVEREHRVLDRRIVQYRVVAPLTAEEAACEPWVREGGPSGAPMANRVDRGSNAPCIKASREHPAVDVIAAAIEAAVGACQVRVA